jgi:hypothetical protein
MHAMMRALTLLCLMLPACAAGCAAARPAAATLSETTLRLSGADTRQKLVIKSDQTITSDEADQVLADGEMCYLQLDTITIECFPFGSLLMMGQEDAVELVYDNPLDDLHADSRDPRSELLLRTLAVLSVIADSVERLPAALADYIDNPDSANPGIARSLAHRLVDSGEVELAGLSRAGPFSVQLELTEDGKEELREALSDRQAGSLQYVHHLHRRLGSPRATNVSR